MLKKDFRDHRDELVISTKAGWDMWSGPYGRGGSRKHVLASLDQSLARMGLDYVDIFYSHRPTNDVPLEETVSALVQMVRRARHFISVFPPIILSAHAKSKHCYAQKACRC